MMEIRYFNETDTLLIDFSNREIIETKDINENVLVEFDKDGELVSMTIEHAKNRLDVDTLLFHIVTEQDSLENHPDAVIGELTSSTSQPFAHAT
jgi:uncharacterized protein YuzE